MHVEKIRMGLFTLNQSAIFHNLIRRLLSDCNQPFSLLIRLIRWEINLMIGCERPTTVETQSSVLTI